MSFERRYQLVSQLGQGGMGVVQRAYDRLSGTYVATKQVTANLKYFSLRDGAHATDHHRIALTHEFMTLAALRHPNIVSVLDYGFDKDGLPYFSMELLEDAATIIQAGRALPFEGKIRLLVQMLEALNYLHRRGILHRDLKPANALVVNGRVKLLDFGLAIEHDHLSEAVVGTMAYMAPEVMKSGTATIASDLYSVGIIAYELFSGAHPFDITNINKLMQGIIRGPEQISITTTHPYVDIEPVSDALPTELLDDTIVDSESIRQQTHRTLEHNVSTNNDTLDGIIRRLIALDPDARYQSSQAVVSDLLAILGERPRLDEDMQNSYLRSATFIGREEELLFFEGVLDQALQGIGTVCLLGGESGVGKSRLLSELRIRAMVKGMAVVVGAATDEANSPYDMFRQPLRHLVLDVDLEANDIEKLAFFLPDIYEFLNREEPGTIKHDATTSQANFFNVVEEVLRQQPRPVVIILEDLHWMSDEDMVLFNRVASLTETLPVVLIGSYRNDEVPDLPEQIKANHHILLKRFTTNEVARLCRAILGKSDGQIIQLLEQETEGNALFVVETLRTLAEAVGQLENIVNHQLPDDVEVETIHNVIDRRLKRLPDGAMDLLQLSAVRGRDIDLMLLQHLDVDTVDWWIDTCVNAAVLMPNDGGWMFAHEKLRQSILAGLDHNTYRQIHGRVANALESIYARQPQYAAALAYHWHEAGNYSAAAGSFLNAGIYALNVGAYQQAATLLERTCELVEHLDQVSHAALLRSLGEACYITGRYEEAQQQLSQANALYETLNDREGQATVLRLLGNVTQVMGNHDQAELFYRTSRTIFTEMDIPLGIARATRELGVMLNSRGRTEEASVLFEESLTRFRQIDDTMGIAGTLTNLGNIDAHNEKFALAKARFTESIERFKQIRFKWGAAYANICLGQVLLVEGQYRIASGHIHEAIQLCEEIGHRWGLGFALKTMADIHLAQSQPVLAREALHHMLLIASEIQVLPLALYGFPAVGDYIFALSPEERAAQGLSHSLAVELYRIAAEHPGSYDETRQAAMTALASHGDETTFEAEAPADADTMLHQLISDLDQ